MPTVETAKGSLDTADLGRVLMHEHVFVLSPEIMQNYPKEWGDEESRVDDAIRRLSELKAAGIDTILDPTAIGLGRYVPRVARIAKEIDLNIVVATGLYTFDVLPMYFRSRSVDAMADMFVTDITEGIGGTGVKASVLKVATDKPGVTPGVEHSLRAVARAHRRTGCPITTHTDARTKRGLEQQKLFAEEGVDLSRVIIGHCGDTEDIEYLEELIAAGSMLGMDRFGIDGLLPTEQRVAVVAELCRRGHAGSMVLSHDASCYLDWIPGEVDTSQTMPNWHYLHISKDVLPALRAQGVTEDQIDMMLVDNPRRFFESQAKGPY
jgi:phosphotriesterase-related protein